MQLIPLALALIGPTAQAQGSSEPTQPQAAIPCPDDRREDCPAAEEKERPVRSRENSAAPQVVADVPPPLVSTPGGPPSLRFERGPLKVRGRGLSLAADHALSPQWVAGAMVEVARGRIEQNQTKYSTTDAGGTKVSPIDTAVNTRSTSLSASLSYFTRDAVAFDAALSFMRTRLDTRRVNDGINEFTGNTISHSYGLWLSTSRIWQLGRHALVPQLGFEYADSRTDPLVAASRNLPTLVHNDLAYTVDAQHQRVLASFLSAQLQQAVSTGFGTLTPYGRLTWRQRLWRRADAAYSINATEDGTTIRKLDPDSADSRSSIAAAFGAIVQFTKGVSSFADLSYRRGRNDLHENRLALGLKFEI